MSNQSDLAARLRAFVDALNAHDVAACVTQVEDHVEISRGGGTKGVGQRALSAILQGLITAFPDGRYLPAPIRNFGPDMALVEGVFEGTHLGPLTLESTLAASGRSVSAQFTAVVFAGKNNAIGRIEVRGDTAGLLSQISGENPAGEAAIVIDPAVFGKMAENYTAAWSSGDPSAVAAFYTDTGGITVNGRGSWMGHDAMVAFAAGFMESVPDMVLTQEAAQVVNDRAIFLWNLKGTHSGPGGTGKAIDISGYEVWRLSAECKVIRSHGYFDNALYQYQIDHGAL